MSLYLSFERYYRTQLFHQSLWTTDKPKSWMRKIHFQWRTFLTSHSPIDQASEWVFSWLIDHHRNWCSWTRLHKRHSSPCYQIQCHQYDRLGGVNWRIQRRGFFRCWYSVRGSQGLEWNSGSTKIMRQYRFSYLNKVIVCNYDVSASLVQHQLISILHLTFNESNAILSWAIIKLTLKLVPIHS